MRLIGTVVVGCAAAVVVAACTSSNPSSNPTKSSASKVVNGGTFTMAISSDPGNLDPQASASSSLFQLSQFAYDALLNADAKGTIESGLATAWKVDGTRVTLTMHDKVTCSDGSAFTAADAAANLIFVSDPANKSPFLGTFIPQGTKATADAAARTLTVTLPSPAPFVLNGLANIPMVCTKGRTNRKLLARDTDGTGPFQLTDAASGDHLTYTKHPGYAWGPKGASTATPGLPDKVVVKIVANETTAANLLISGQLNAAAVLGADAQRLEQAHLFTSGSSGLLGEMWFNHATPRPAADAAVRKALTQALDLDQLAKVLSSGRGTTATSFAATAPVACPGSSVGPALPSHGLDAAKQVLESAGWAVGSGGIRAKGGTLLSLTFVYTTGTGSGAAAAAQLATQTWKQLGAKVTVKPQDETALSQTIFGTSNWDIAWLTLNVSSPDQLVPFLSGPVPPKGNNFAHVDNTAYTAGVTKASAMIGAAGCDEWLTAEANLVREADVVPFANQIYKTFGRGARFDFNGLIVPTSIRLLAS